MAKRMLQLLVMVFMVALASHQARAADLVTMIVPFPPGGTSDVLARPLAADLAKALGVTMIVDNKPGAAGNIGAQALARSKPDGNTLLFTAAAISVAPALHSDPGFKLFDQIQPVSVVGTVPFMLVVKKGIPANSAKEFFDYVRQNPGKLNLGSGGTGTIVHLAGELLKQRTGLEFTHIPFRGGALAMQDIVAGHVDFTIDGGPHVVTQIEAGTVKLLAVATSQRLAAYPDVPTIAELGVPGFEATAWQALFIRAGTAPDMVEKLNREVAASIAAPANRERLLKLGVLPVASSVKDTERFVRDEVAKWGEVVRAAKVTAN